MSTAAEPRAASAELVRLNGITKQFGAFTANDRIDLLVRAGEIHALLGENGAGKSTLMKILTGLLAPDDGAIFWRGEPLVLEGPRAARARGITMVFQHFSLFEALSGLENIALVLPGRRADGRLRHEVLALEERFGLAVAVDRPVWTLSAGERQRIEIVRALLQAPTLLILDEPTSVLTPQEATDLFAVLERLATSGTAILFISHKLEEVRRLCRTATVLRAGKVVATADPRRESAATLAALMVGEGVKEASRGQAPRAGAAVLQLDTFSMAPQTEHGVALKNIALTVRTGEIVAVVGVAGNGQSEFFAAISGEGGPPTSGSISIGGTNASRLPISARRRLGAAFVPETRLGHATLPKRPLSENVLLSWHATDRLATPFVRRGRLRSLSSAVIDRFDVRVPEPDPRAEQLSGGNLQKFTVGREIARKPTLLVVDQPTWGVDAKAAERIRTTLVEVARGGAAVLMITQDLDEAFQISDRIAVLYEGRLGDMLQTASTSRGAIGLAMAGGRSGGETPAKIHRVPPGSA